MENQNSARDVFMYLLVVVVLGMSAGNLGTLLFQYVNLYVPDITQVACSGSWCQDAIRWALASIIVVFPVLVWAWRFLQKDVQAHPEKKGSRIRRWLLYFTLFISGCFLIGDAVSLVYSWLQGDLTVQFALKVLIVLYISGSIFYYFLEALNDNRGYAPFVGKLAIVVVCVAIVVGFLASGSPFRARVERIDEQRVSNLQLIQDRIVYDFWQSKGRLPTTLSELETDLIGGFAVPVDPERKESYEYTRKTDQTFVLCATFSAENISNSVAYPREIYTYGDQMNTWNHDAGRVCFERAIDPQLYPIKK